MNRMIAHLDNPIESRREEIQSAIDATKSAAQRNRLGQYATPFTLAVEIARYVASLPEMHTCDVRFADPSIGTGSFFSAALSVFGADSVKSAVGIEIDPVFADAAQSLWARKGLEIVRGDFTHIVANSSRPPAPNFVLANPPYVRHHHINRQEKKRLQALAFTMTGIEVNGLAGLYVYFLLLTTAWMNKGGYAAWLVPSEFMDVNYGTALKQFLTAHVTLIRVHRFDPDDVQFCDALVSSVVLVFRKAPSPRNHAPEFTFGGTMAKPHACDCVSLTRLRESRKWTAFPKHAKNDRHTISDVGGPTLSDFFRVTRGIATGNNKFFVLSRTDAARRNLPGKYLRPILPSPRHLKTTVIEEADDGYPILDRQLCVIDCDLPEHVVKQRHSNLWTYLQSAKALGVHDGYLIRKRSPWYKQEQREPCPFLCTYMGRGSDDKQPFRFILNRSRAVATNVYLLLYPKSSLATMLRLHPERAVDVHELLSCVTGHELRGEGRIYGGGLNKIEPRELGRISAATFVERWPGLGESVRRVKTASLFD